MLKKLLIIILGCGTMNAESIWQRDPLEVREKINQRIMAIEAEAMPVTSVEDIDFSTPLRLYRANGSEKIILLIHGGAWVAGNLNTHDNLARYLCAKTGSIVVSVGYLNSPEGKFPFPLEQCYEALQWTVQNLKPSSLIVVGDSAGGNLAAALCLMARDRGGPKIDAQVLINPVTDLTADIDILRWQAHQYLSDPSDATNPYVSPLLAENLQDLPPALIVLAEYDDLRPMGQKYAERLDAKVYCQMGTDHLAGYGARAAKQALESLDTVCEFIDESDHF